MASPQVTDKRRRMARWLTGSGIEIGALHNPLPLPPAAKIRYVDRYSVAQLREHYAELKDEVLAPVSLIGNAQDLSCLSDDSVDFVVANHLFEHLDNPIQGLKEMVRVLRPGGVLYLALPEPRVTFDSYRELTTVQHVVDEYRDGPLGTREAHFADWVENVEAYLEDARVDDIRARAQSLSAMDYSIHYHVWRPDTFMDFLAAAKTATGIALELVDFAPCDGGKDNEFIFVFLKGIAKMPVAIPPMPVDGSNDLPVAALPGRMKRLKIWVAGSFLAPVLRPIYRTGKRSYSAAQHRLTRR